MIRTRRHFAFTLLELVLVLIVIAVVMAMAAPSLRGWGRGNKLRDATDQLLAVARFGHVQAVAQAQLYRLNVDPQSNRYWLTMQDGEQFVNIPSDFGQAFSLPEGFQLELLDLNGAPVPSIDFFPNGRTQPARMRLSDESYAAVIECPAPAEGFHLVNGQTQ